MINGGSAGLGIFLESDLQEQQWNKTKEEKQKARRQFWQTYARGESTSLWESLFSPAI